MNITRMARPAISGIRCFCLANNQLLVINSQSAHTIIRFSHNSRKPICKRNEAKKVRFFIVQKYIEYLKRLETVLDKRFPNAMKVYKQFTEGTHAFVRDAIDYFKIVIFLSKRGNSFSNLTRTDMELYCEMPKDMKKVTPILIMCAVPFGTVALPLIYMFPRQLLSSHFWTLQQKIEFQTINLKIRLSENKPVFRHLQSQINFLKCHRLFDEWKDIIGMMGSGVNPSPQHIAKCKELFMYEPYHLFYLSRNHVVHLMKMHGMYVGFFFRRSRLAERAFILKEMDKAIIREGGIESLPVDVLRKACYIRGLNPVNLKNDEMTKYLEDWIELSSHVTKDCYSLILHAPILLGYNKPSNWSLIYKDNQLK